MESIKLSVQTDHKFLMRASIFCRCITNVKTLIRIICQPPNLAWMCSTFRTKRIAAHRHMSSRGAVFTLLGLQAGGT